MARPATTGELGRLRQLAGAGLTAPAIGRELGRAPVTVRKWCRQHGVTLATGLKNGTRPFSSEETLTLTDLAAAGYTGTHIARTLGRPVRAVYVKASALKIRLRPLPKVHEVRFSLERELADALREMAGDYGFSMPAFIRHILAVVTFDNLFVALLGIPPPQPAAGPRCRASSSAGAGSPPFAG